MCSRASGITIRKEYVTITEAMNKPKRPLVAVIGGAKVSDKILLIKRLIKKADSDFNWRRYVEHIFTLSWI